MQKNVLRVYCCIETEDLYYVTAKTEERQPQEQDIKRHIGNGNPAGSTHRGRRKNTAVTRFLSVQPIQ